MMRLLACLLLLSFPAIADVPVTVNGQNVTLYGITDADIDALNEWLRQPNITIEPAPQPHDRFGHALVKAIDSNGKSVQAALVEQGMALVATQPGTNAIIADELLPLEQQARTAHRGHWADTYHVYDVNSVPVDTFAIVQGRVQNVAVVKGTTYVNFGADWKTDFTISMTSAFARSLHAVDWNGLTLRVRGWVQNKNGALITVTHKEQVEILN